MSSLKNSIFIFFLVIQTSLVAQETPKDITVSTDTAKQIQEIAFTSNGVVYSYKSDRIIDFSNKTNIVFPEGTTISLTEKRNNTTIEAELRVGKEGYQLFFLKEGELSVYYDNDEEWLKNFMNNIITMLSQNTAQTNISMDLSPLNTVVNDSTLQTEPSMDVFLSSVKKLNLETNRFELLSKKISLGLNLKEQKKIIGFIFGNFNIEENKVKLLEQLIESPSYSTENNDYLISFIDQLHLETNKVNLLKKLLR